MIYSILAQRQSNIACVLKIRTVPEEDAAVPGIMSHVDRTSCKGVVQRAQPCVTSISRTTDHFLENYARSWSSRYRR